MKRFFNYLYPFLLVCFSVVMFLKPITAINDDLGRHILLGNIILKEHSVPNTNLLSYTNTDFPFINTSWLFAVFAAKTVSLFGFNGLLSLSLAVVLVACFIQARYAIRRFSTNSVLAVSTIYLLLLAFRTDIRPEIFSMLFLSVFIVALFSFREKTNKKIIFLIPLEILWVNTHIYFLAGPLIISLFLIEFLVRKQAKKIPFLLFTLIGTFAATLINPYGIKGSLFPITFFQNYGFDVIENQSIFTLINLYQERAIALPIIVIILLTFINVLFKKKTSPAEWISLIIFSLLSLFYFRNILLFVFSTYIIAVAKCDLLFDKFKQKKWFPAGSFSAIYPVSIFILFVLIVKSIIVDSVGFGVKEYGRGSVDFLIQKNIEGPIFNNFNIGGYLTYRIYPRKVFIDNRPEAYPEDFFQHIYNPLYVRHGSFDELDKKYNFNVLILSHWDNTSMPDLLLESILTNKKFHLVYLDDYAIVAVKNNQKNMMLIKKNEIKKEDIKLTNYNDVSTLIHYLYFFQKAGWLDKSNEALLQLKKLDPSLCSLSPKRSLFLMDIDSDYYKDIDFKKCEFIL